MIKKFLIISALIASNLCYAGTSGNGVVIVNIDKVRIDTKVGKSISTQLETIQNNFRDKVSKIQQDFDTKKLELDKQMNILSKEAFKKKEAEFQKNVADARTNIQKEAEGIEQAQQNALQEFNLIATNIITDLAKEHGYQQVLPAALVIYSDSKTDITSQIIADIDKKIDTIAVKLVAAK